MNQSMNQSVTDNWVERSVNIYIQQSLSFGIICSFTQSPCHDDSAPTFPGRELFSSPAEVQWDTDQPEGERDRLAWRKEHIPLLSQFMRRWYMRQTLRLSQTWVPRVCEARIAGYFELLPRLRHPAFANTFSSPLVQRDVAALKAISHLIHPALQVMYILM